MRSSPVQQDDLWTAAKPLEQPKGAQRHFFGELHRHYHHPDFTWTIRKYEIRSNGENMPWGGGLYVSEAAARADWDACYPGHPLIEKHLSEPEPTEMPNWQAWFGHLVQKEGKPA